MKRFSGFVNLTEMICFRNFGLAVILTLLMSFSVAQAQTTTGRISGTVTDATDAIVPNASVTASNGATNVSRTVMSDENGFYTVPSLPVGTYNVSAEVPNFKKSVKTGNVLSADGRLTVDFALEAGQISEVVEIVQATGNAFADALLGNFRTYT